MNMFQVLFDKRQLCEVRTDYRCHLSKWCTNFTSSGQFYYSKDIELFTTDQADS